MRDSIPSDRSIRVAIVDDDRESREGIAWIIDTSDGFTSVGTFASCREAQTEIEREAPDVVLMDVDMPSVTGIECVGKLKAAFPDIEILMLTVYSDDEKIFQSLRAGAVGYLLKKTSPQKLLEAIRDAREGGAPMSSEIARKVLQAFRPATGANLQSQLSPREQEFLEALIEGHSYKAIAEKLFVSVHTVRFHLHNIYAKLHVNSRSEAIAKAMKNRMG